MNETAIAINPRIATPLPATQALLAAEQAYRGLLSDQPDHFRALCGLAAVRCQLGSSAEARDLLTKAVAVARPAVEDQITLGTAFRRINDLDSARRHFEAAVKLDEKHAEAHLHLANVLLAKGDLAGAVTHYGTALEIDPNNAEAHQSAGLALQRLRRFEAAIPHHTAALNLKPNFAVAHVGLGDACRHLERYDDAIAHYERALAINPQLSDAYVNLGGTLQVTGRREEAIGVYQRALTASPGLAEAHYNLGNLYADLDSFPAAVSHYERAIALRPTAEAYNNLGNVFRKQGRIADAIVQYERAVRLKPQYATAQRQLGDALLAQSRPDEAVARYRAALSTEPEDAITLNHLASALLVAGRIDDASRAYEAVIDIAPENLGIQLNYAAVKKFTKDDPRLVRLEEFAARADALSDDQRIALHFTLGKAYADLKDAERSFHHLELGNALKRRYMGYDERETLAHIGRIRDSFARKIMDARSDVGHPSDAPIFVLGMPRSGTSLVEQILASHPRIFGAGELTEFAVATETIARRNATTFPEMLRKLSNDDLHELGKIYVESVIKLTGPHQRIVDKMPSNFLFAGLIRLALPRARIIHVKRDPVDTCLSCYSLLFSEGQAFAYELAELGRYYRAYDALMGHWREVLPAEGFHEVQYEDLVNDLDGGARRLVAFCGLDWDDRCLSFHETKRPVQTASLVQVRKPIYADSVGRWRFYGDRLKPLLDALDVGAPPSPAAVETVAAPPTQPAADAATASTRTNLQGLQPPAALEPQVDRAFLLAKRLQERGDLAIAEQLYGFVLGVRPQHFESLLAMGAICATTSRYDAAKSYLTQAIAVNPNVGEAHGSLAAVHASAGELDTALPLYEKALTLSQDHPGILYAYAAVLNSLGRNQEAVDCLKRALAKRPENIDAHFLLGNVYFAMGGRDGDSAACYLKVLQYSPRHPETYNNLANVLLRQGHAERAIGYYRKAFEFKPDYADAYGNLGNAFLELNRLEESIEQNKRALELKPHRFGSYNNLGVAYQALGQFEEATEAFARAIELSPNEGPIHLNLANMAKFEPNDRRMPGLRRLIENVDQLDQEKQIAAHFAMGKALADLKQHDEAFAHLKQANILKRRSFDYDEPQRLAMFENVKSKFPPERFQALSGCGDTSWSPIFIVGMPRSGTTLMEQVLASHSRVHGAGELETFKDLIGECIKSKGILPAYPDLVDQLAPEQIADLGRLYTTRVRALAPDAPHIVDKMPLNFVFAGLIHMALPNARIIHVRRDPLDTCVSCYSLLFTGSQPFAYDLGEVGRYYRGYETVMEHWHKVLPSGVMMDVQYEDLVADLEGVSRGVLAHCGLEWEDACRDFHDTKRAVRTASLMQVREPLYKRAVGSWRRYEKHLGPLFEALGLDPAGQAAAS